MDTQIIESLTKILDTLNLKYFIHHNFIFHHSDPKASSQFIRTTNNEVLRIATAVMGILDSYSTHYAIVVNSNITLMNTVTRKSSNGIRPTDQIEGFKEVTQGKRVRVVTKMLPKNHPSTLRLKSDLTTIVSCLTPGESYMIDLKEYPEIVMSSAAKHARAVAINEFGEYAKLFRVQPIYHNNTMVIYRRPETAE